MPASIGVNLRVTGHCRQGGRKYMEDFFSVAYQQTEDEKDLEYAFFGIYDGHGGGEAATYAKEHLMESIVRQKNFWSDKDEDVLKAIKEGYISTHYAMWKEQEKWPKTASGLPSTAGTTASVAFIRRGKIYIGHVGDSGIILGYQEPGNNIWKARPLTKDHKPENESEMSRIESCGGKVVTKSGVPRVVWNRPRIGHKGPVRRSTPIDEIPFLAVARSLGDLWSYNSALDEFVVSPDPDTMCIPIDSDSFRCLIFGTDGLWNMISPTTAVFIVQGAEQHNEKTVLAGNEPQQINDSNQNTAGRTSKVWINPSKCLVERALERWSSTRMRADNTSVITLMLDPPGPPRAEVIKNQKIMQEKQKTQNLPTQTDPYPKNGLEIMTMYQDSVPDTSKPQPLTPTTTTDEKLTSKVEIEPLNKENCQQLQINEVSSSSSELGCTRCTRSHDSKRDLPNAKQTRSADQSGCSRCTRSHDVTRDPPKAVRASSESPKRKTRPLRNVNRKILTSKREHEELKHETIDRLAPGPSNITEPPQKLRRSRSLGPRDFTLRSSDLKRSLRERDKPNRLNLLSSFRKLSTTQTRPFTPVRQTRNRLKRLNNK